MSLSKVPEKWDGEADIIVVGGGNSGLPAAITAHDKGAKVMVLEASGGMASSLAMIAGGTPFTGTDLQKAEGIEDSPDNLYEEAVKVSGGDPELWRALADRQHEVYEWLVSLGAKPERVLLAPGHLVRRSIKFEGHGPALCKILRDAAAKKKIDIKYHHRAKKLIQDPDTGRVIGVAAENENKVKNYKAKKAVILATGGFCQNLEIVKEFGPHYADLVPTAPKTHQGDGLKMAMAIGAGTDGLGLAVCPSMPVGAETLQFVNSGLMGGITIDRWGKRFGNEATEELGTYTEKHKMCLDRDPTGLHISVSCQAIRDLNPPPGKTKEPIYKADTIEDLARQLDIDPKALKETVDEYNSDIEKYGYDRKYGRKFLGMAWPEKPVMPLTPPFYAVKNKICLTSMKGGLKINAKCQIVDQFGDVIPGLYAAGEVSGGLERIPHHYYTGRMTVQAFTQGRIAGDRASD
jgi:flavocytochrome c